MVGNTNAPTMVHSSNKATYTEQEEINDLNEDLYHLRYGLVQEITSTMMTTKTAMITQLLPTID